MVTAEQAVAAFLQVESAGLAGELAGLAAAARDAQQAAVRALTRAVDADRRVRAKWRRLLRANGQTDTLEASPLRGWDDDLIAGGGTVPLTVRLPQAGRTASEHLGEPRGRRAPQRDVYAASTDRGRRWRCAQPEGGDRRRPGPCLQGRRPRGHRRHIPDLHPRHELGRE